jgi:hypothetical protein
VSDDIQTGSIIGFIKQAIVDGKSATSALKDFRAADGAIRNQRWYSAFGEVKASLAQKEEIATLRYDLLPRADQFVEWAAGKAGTYGYQIEVVQRDAGADNMFTSRYTLLSPDLLTPDEAVAQAMEDYSQSTGEGGTNEGITVLGGTVVNLYQMTGRPRK